MEGAINELLKSLDQSNAVTQAVKNVDAAFKNYNVIKQSYLSSQESKQARDLVCANATALYHALVDMRIMVGASPVHAMGSGDPATFLQYAFSTLQMENNIHNLGLSIIQ